MTTQTTQFMTSSKAARLPAQTTRSTDDTDRLRGVINNNHGHYQHKGCVVRVIIIIVGPYWRSRLQIRPSRSVQVW